MSSSSAKPDMSYFSLSSQFSKSTTDPSMDAESNLFSLHDFAFLTSVVTKRSSDGDFRDDSSQVNDDYAAGAGRIGEAVSVLEAMVLVEKEVSVSELDDGENVEDARSPPHGQTHTSPTVLNEIIFEPVMPDSSIPVEPDCRLVRFNVGGGGADQGDQFSGSSKASTTIEDENSEAQAHHDEASICSPDLEEVEQYKDAMYDLAPVLRNNIDTIIATYRSGTRLVAIGSYVLEILDERGHCQIIEHDFQQQRQVSRSGDGKTASEWEDKNEEKEDGEQSGVDSEAGLTRPCSFAPPLEGHQSHREVSSATERKDLVWNKSHTSTGIRPEMAPNRRVLSILSNTLVSDNRVSEAQAPFDQGAPVDSMQKALFSASYDHHISSERPSKLSPTLQRAKARLRKNGIIRDTSSSSQQGMEEFQRDCSGQMSVQVSSIELGPMTFVQDGLGRTLFICGHHSGTQSFVGGSRSERRKAQATSAKSETRWSYLKKRDIIKSKRPKKPIEQDKYGIVTFEEAPLRAYAGSEHRQLPRPKMARNLLSRQYGVRIGHESEWWSQRECKLSIGPAHFERQLLEHQSTQLLPSQQGKHDKQVQVDYPTLDDHHSKTDEELQQLHVRTPNSVLDRSSP